VYVVARMRHAGVVEARLRNLAAISWLGGAACLFPFAEQWFGLASHAADVVLFAALVSSVVLGLVIRASTRAQRALVRLAGPTERPARALVLVAVFASGGALVMLGATAAVGAR
jgi:hypothetical protein